VVVVVVVVVVQTAAAIGPAPDLCVLLYLFSTVFTVRVSGIVNQLGYRLPWTHWTDWSTRLTSPELIMINQCLVMINRLVCDPATQFNNLKTLDVPKYFIYFGSSPSNNLTMSLVTSQGW